jgi:type III secretion system YopN/LcrE/InvE/MxiC family regulator
MKRAGLEEDSDKDDIEGDDAQDENGEAAGAAGGAKRAEARRAISAALQQFDSDVSHQFTALQYLLEEFAEEALDPEFQAALDDISRHFEDNEVARDVRAGIASGRAAHAAAATLGADPAAVRDAYRAMIRQEMSYSKLFDALLKFDPLKNGETILETFCLAVGADLTNMTGPSSDPVLLRALLDELGKLKKLRTVLDGCSKLVEDVESMLQGAQKGLLKSPAVASRLLAFISRASVSTSDALALLGELARMKPGAKLIFFNGVEYLLVLVPDEMFPNMRARLAQKKALRKANEKAVEEEEDEYAREQGLTRPKQKKREEGKRG